MGRGHRALGGQVRTILLPQAVPAPRTLVAYHGTRAAPETMWREGLRIPNVDALFEKVEGLREDYGVPPPPRWVLLMAQERVRQRVERPCVHLTLNRAQAISYSAMGGEIIVELGEYLLWRRYSPYRLRGEMRREAWEKLYDFMRGPHRWVVTVEVPWEWLLERDRRAYLELKEHGFIPEQVPWDICIDRDIPPQMIRAIERVEA